MKWKHWLVWGLLAVWAIGLGACVGVAEKEKRYTKAEVDAMVKKAVVATRNKYEPLIHPLMGGPLIVLHKLPWPEQQKVVLVSITTKDATNGGWSGFLEFHNPSAP